MRTLLASFVLAHAVTGCTESPGYLPPCADPQVDCPPLDAGVDVVEGGKKDGAVIDAGPVG